MARGVVMEQHPGAVIHVADAKTLGRTLPLTVQLAELGQRIVLVLNMMETDHPRARKPDASLRQATPTRGQKEFRTLASMMQRRVVNGSAPCAVSVRLHSPRTPVPNILHILTWGSSRLVARPVRLFGGFRVGRFAFIGPAPPGSWSTGQADGTLEVVTERALALWFGQWIAR